MSPTDKRLLRKVVDWEPIESLIDCRAVKRPAQDAQGKWVDAATQPNTHTKIEIWPFGGGHIDIQYFERGVRVSRIHLKAIRAPGVLAALFANPHCFEDTQARLQGTCLQLYYPGED